MKGRGGDTDDEVQLLDVELLDTDGAHTRDDIVRAPGGVLTMLGVAVSLGLVFFLASSSDEPPEQASPSTTAPVDTTTSTLSDSERREAALTNLGVVLGDGPALDWQRVDADVDTMQFASWADGFIGDNGTTEFRVWLNDGRAVFDERPSPLLSFPNHRLQTFGGERLLVPKDPIPDHVLVLPADDTEPVRVDLPPFEDLPQGELIESAAWVYGSIVGDRFVAAISTDTQVDVAAVALRTGRELSDAMFVEVAFDRIRVFGHSSTLDPILYEDVDFTETEIAQLQETQNHVERVYTIDIATGSAEPVDLPDLQWIDMSPVQADGTLTVTYADGNHGLQTASTTDGVTWSREAMPNMGWFIDSGTQLFDVGGDPSIRRSLDDGETWTSARMPRSDAQPILANNVLAFGRSWNSSFSGEEVLVESSSEDYALFIVGDARFEVRPLANDTDPVLTGHLWEQFSGAVWNETANEHVFNDPTTGEELLGVSASALAIALAKASPLNEVMLGHWPADEEAPEWLLVAPSEIFGEGTLTVDFVAGDGQLLAIATTAEGYQLYLADVTGAL